MKCFAAILITIAYLLLALVPDSAVAVKDTWTGVRSNNLLVVGNANEGDVRQVAVWLELFHDVFSHLLAKPVINSSVPTTVIVFKSDSAYRPFKPVYQGRPVDVAGYFQPGPDVNYITLATEATGRDPLGTAFHEYVHLRVRDNVPNAPLWLNEGLAEYYSTFELTNGQVVIGAPIPYYIRLLRQSELVPLQTLFNVEHSSAHYNEQDKRGIFYAESWALVHYLLLGDNNRRQPQLARYLNLLAAGVSIENSFQLAFQTDFSTLEKELREYIARGSFPTQAASSTRRLDSHARLRTTAISEAEAQFHLGDLLLHINRPGDAEAYFQQAIALEPDLALAHAALGMLRMRQNRFADAKRHLQRATASSQNYLVHYYYAYMLSREGANDEQSVKGYAPEKLQTIRAELKKAIDLAPDFADAYYLLGFVNLVSGEELDGAEALVKRAISLAPDRDEFALVLAQIHLRQRDTSTAEQILTRLARSADRDVRAQAQELLEKIANVDGGASSAGARGATSPGAAIFTAKSTPPGGSRQTETPRPTGPVAGGRVPGLLVQIACPGASTVLFVKTGDRILRLYSAGLERIKFSSYVPDVSEVTCGVRRPANPVFVTYRPASNTRARFDGEVIAVEFVPANMIARQ